MEVTVNSTTISLIQGDITLEKTDAIVNAANSMLAGGGGVDGAIHRAGGPKIMEECRKIGGCPTGKAVITTGGELSAKYVIHTVGPIYKDGLHGEEGLLKSAYTSSLTLAVEKGLKTIAFPSISTGAYGYPTEDASVTALTAVIEFVKKKPGLKLVRFVLFSKKDLEIYQNSLSKLISLAIQGVH